MACLSPPVTRAGMVANDVAKKQRQRQRASGGAAADDEEEGDEDEDEEEADEDNDEEADWFCPQCDCLQVCRHARGLFIFSYFHSFYFSFLHFALTFIIRVVACARSVSTRSPTLSRAACPSQRGKRSFPTLHSRQTRTPQL
jgi:hypothetical protein